MGIRAPPAIVAGMYAYTDDVDVLVVGAGHSGLAMSALLSDVNQAGLGRSLQFDLFRPGQVVVRPMMYLALSYDHRLVDGREAVQFLVRIKDFIEDPAFMLVEG